MKGNQMTIITSGQQKIKLGLFPKLTRRYILVTPEKPEYDESGMSGRCVNLHSPEQLDALDDWNDYDRDPNDEKYIDLFGIESAVKAARFFGWECNIQYIESYDQELDREELPEGFIKPPHFRAFARKHHVFDLSLDSDCREERIPESIRNKWNEIRLFESHDDKFQYRTDDWIYCNSDAYLAFHN
jgi:hypothetical protein